MADREIDLLACEIDMVHRSRNTEVDASVSFGEQLEGERSGRGVMRRALDNAVVLGSERKVRGRKVRWHQSSTVCASSHFRFLKSCAGQGDLTVPVALGPWRERPGTKQNVAEAL
jgi:hypothetical protein